MELKGKEPRTYQKTVRVPVAILRALEEEVGKVENLTVPAAMVQILEDWYKKREAAKASKSA